MFPWNETLSAELDSNLLKAHSWKIIIIIIIIIITIIIIIIVITVIKK